MRRETPDKSRRFTIDKSWIPVIMAVLAAGGVGTGATGLWQGQSAKTNAIDSATVYTKVLNDQLTIIDSLNDRVSELTHEVSRCNQ
jgi:hypothetical protein